MRKNELKFEARSPEGDTSIVVAVDYSEETGERFFYTSVRQPNKPESRHEREGLSMGEAGRLFYSAMLAANPLIDIEKLFVGDADEMLADIPAAGRA